MIHEFSCKNFHSFKNLSSLSFIVNKKAPKNENYFNSDVEGRLSKIEVLIGANASGKTNLMRVLPFIKWIMVDSYRTEPDSTIPVKTFAFQEKNEAPAEVSVSFEMKKTIYTYNLKITRERIVSEELIAKSKSMYRITSKTVFVREWDEKKQAYIFDEKKFGFPSGTYDLLRTNSSVIASAFRGNHKLSQDITNYWRRLETNVVKYGYVDMDKYLDHSLIYYAQNEALKQRAVKILSRFDLGLEDMFIVKKGAGEKEKLGVDFSHVIKNKSYTLSIDDESSGIKKLVPLLQSILRVLYEGGVVVLDEIDVNLHPEIVLALLSLFIHPETNPNNAQLVFSTHSHQVLSVLEKYQINLTQKNEEGGTIAWRLDTNSDVDNQEDLFAKYLSGTYGATPRIDL